MIPWLEVFFDGAEELGFTRHEAEAVLAAELDREPPPAPAVRLEDHQRDYLALEVMRRRRPQRLTAQDREYAALRSMLIARAVHDEGLGDEDAEEVVQEALFALWRNHTPPRNPGGWLTVRVRWRCRDCHRKTKQTERLLDLLREVSRASS